MKQIKLSKQTIIVIVLSLVALFMLPTEFHWSNTYLDFMDDMELIGLLFVVFYVTFGLTDVFMAIDQTDLAKLSAAVNTGTIVGAVIIRFIKYFDGGFWFDLGISAYINVAISVIALLVVHKYAKTKT